MVTVENNMAEFLLESLTKERLKRLSRSSICDVTGILSNAGPELLKRINTRESNELVSNESLEGGRVSLQFTNGNTYEGGAKAGMLDGHGLFRWSDGTTYEGEFRRGQISGKGVYTWEDGSCYIGEVRNSLRHGQGTFHHANGRSIYEGKWSNGVKEGKGKLIYDGQGNSYYEGEWSNDKQCGYGFRKYNSGNTYQGTWKECRRHGNGTMVWVDRGEKYIGEWRNGVQNGMGEYFWFMKQKDNSQFPVCNRYAGQWVNGARHGKGTFYYASGGCYEGGWYSNKKHGDGQYILANGQVIQGVFREDKLTSRQVGKMTENDISAVRPKTPLGSLIGDIDGTLAIGSTTQQFNTGISNLIPPSADVALELQQVHCIVLRYLTQLKRTYHFYSSLYLGPNESSQPKVLKRIQLWQLLADCELHIHQIILTDADAVIQKAVAKGDSEDQSYTPFLMREFLQCIVFIAHAAYSNKESSLSWCIDQFMQQDFIPKACKVKGLSFQYINVTSPYLEPIGTLYSELSADSNGVPTLRDFVLFLQSYSAIGSGALTVRDVVRLLVEIQPLAQEEESYNLDISMIFLEFFNAIVSCSIHWYRTVACNHDEDTCINSSGPEPNVDNQKQGQEEDAKELSQDESETVEVAVAGSGSEVEEEEGGCGRETEERDAEPEVRAKGVKFEDEVAGADKRESVDESNISGGDETISTTTAGEGNTINSSDQLQNAVVGFLALLKR